MANKFRYERLEELYGIMETERLERELDNLGFVETEGVSYMGTKDKFFHTEYRMCGVMWDVFHDAGVEMSRESVIKYFGEILE